MGDVRNNDPAPLEERTTEADDTIMTENTGLLHIKPDSNLNEIKVPGRHLVQNVVVLSIGFMVHFTAGSSIGQLQSSVNPDAGLGVYSHAASYTAMLFSSLFLPTILIRKYSAKLTIIFAMLGYTFYMGAQFYPTFSTLIPSGILMGLCAAPLWSAKSTYITLVAQKYANLKDDCGKAGDSELVMVRFFGIFALFFQTANIWGNILATTILSIGVQKSAWDLHSLKDVSVCGPSFCPANAEDPSILIRPPQANVNLLLVIYLLLAFTGVGIIAFFLDSFEKTDHSGKSELSISDTTSPLIATFRHMLKPLQILLIPLTLWSGLEQGFFTADFYQAYVTCSWGVENLGIVIIIYGLCNALSSISLGPVIRRIGRFPVFLAGGVMNFTLIYTMFKWQPDPSRPAMFFLISGIWGIANSIWHTQLKGLYGSIFKGSEEAAYSNYTLWESLGFVIAFVNGGLLCVDAKLWMLVFVLSVGIIGYIIVEVLEKRSCK